ncbi:MAG: hypothetical protein K8R39_12725 [Arcobacteraceae bacterium]|nr:hypothetical protein [Arcobacteraceae bacterium]
MKQIKIPNEENSTLDGHQKVMYAPNENGKFQTFNYGSNIEEYATKLAVEEYKILQKECLENIKNNISSPIEYYMYKNRMDIPTLASVVGFFQFKVKRHLKAKYFRKLNDKILQKYSDIFGITINDLKGFSDGK